MSLLSDSGVSLEDISRLVGHSQTTVTETVYRKQIRPMLLGGAEAMDRIFAGKATSVAGKWPLTCVGVAGFEPTTSSSRTLIPRVIQRREIPPSRVDCCALAIGCR